MPYSYHVFYEVEFSNDHHNGILHDLIKRVASRFKGRLQSQGWDYNTHYDLDFIFKNKKDGQKFVDEINLYYRVSKIF
jgi:hypothetical protein